MVITGMAHAVPGAVDHQALWDDFFREHFGEDRRAERVWRTCGVRTRHGVAIPPLIDVSGWGTEARMLRYVDEALPLGKEAVAAALDQAGLTASAVGLLAVVSCTGYATPGLDILLARDLDMSSDVQRLVIGHMGCYAALPGLGAVTDYVTARGRPAVLLCVELPSLHVQPASTRMDLQQVIAHALFGDAAAAVVVAPYGDGPAVTDVVARTDTTSSDHMTWDVTDLGFRLGLSARVPDVLSRHARPLVNSLLSRNGLGLGDVTAWAVHPGGPRILDVVADRLGLAGDDLDSAHDVLRDYGNCSSATVLLVLERLWASLAPGSHCVALAFGPGLTLYAILLSA